jgi:hypothetical protein
MPNMIDLLKRSAAAAAMIGALAFSPTAHAAEAGHMGHPGGGIHIGAGGGGGGGTPFGAMPHRVAPGFQGGGIKHNYSGNQAGPIGLMPNRHQNPRPGIVSSHPGGGNVKHWNNGGDRDGDHHEHHQHHRRHLFVYSLPAYDNYYDDSYDDSYGDNTCRYYWHRYQQTGNPKWKWRYYDCIG